MKLVQTLEKPIGGYWDGGLKSVFEWELQGGVFKDGRGCYMKVGSYAANHWFMTAVRKTPDGEVDEKATLRIVQRRLARYANKSGIKCKFEIKES